jgi:hypothetical protein
MKPMIFEEKFKKPEIVSNENENLVTICYSANIF